MSHPKYEEFLELAQHLMAGLRHIIDDDDMRRVDGVVRDIAIQLGERPDAWEGAATIGLMVTEQLVGEEGPWAQSKTELQASNIVACTIIIRLFSHPLMAPILQKWSREGN